jgi:hypothetical protein
LEQLWHNLYIKMTERIHKATLSQSQGREGWSVIFRHPVLLDRTTGKPGRRVRRGLGTKDQKVAKRLIAELNGLLADKLFWQASSRATALTRFSPLVVDIFYHDMMPEQADGFTTREIAMRLPKSSESDYRQVLLLGTTGGGKTTLVRQFLGTDPVSERFPSTSTARTTVADTEIFFSTGPFRAVITFLPRDEVRDYLEESMAAAALAAYHGEPDAEVLRRLLDHVDQRFRLSYVLGGADPEGTDSDELADDSFADSHDFDLTETRKLLTSSVKRLRQIAHQHIPGLLEKLQAAESDEIVREELFEDALDNLLRSDDRFQILADDLMDEIGRRFESLPGELAKTKQGWPESWFYESDDRHAFLKIVSRFTSNYAPRFGTLLTPLVNGIRVAGRFVPRWFDKEFPFVLLDGEGLGHTPDPAASLSTSITRRFEDVDAILLVDNAAQPMQAATVAAMRSLASNGQTDKLIFCFTHFDNVVGDNIPTLKLREQHVLASAENALTSIGEELGSFAERALRQRLASACFFLGQLHQTLTADTKSGKRTIEQLRQLLAMIDGIVVKRQPVASRPVYDRTNLVLGVKQAAEEFQTAWKARLALRGKTGILKQHWRRIKALARRFSEGWSDEYQDLKPLADLHQQVQEAVYRFIQSPVEWTGPVPSDDEKQQVFTELASDISIHLLIPAAERVQDEALQMWREAYHLRGENATFRRAILIRSRIFEEIVPLLERSPDANRFMNDIIRVVRDAAERHSVMLH